MSHEAVTHLRQLLEEERALLMAGKIAGLAPLAPRIEAAQAALALAAPGQMRALAALALENRALLESAQAGVRAAIARLAAIRAAQNGLNGYTADGSRRQNTLTAHQVERRA
ncbi:MAG: hypothetical protein ORN49_04390 [Rhodobacteraceae bacterium]|nr:hypothetical protein [Paracoccaceae bacterium]